MFAYLFLLFFVPFYRSFPFRMRVIADVNGFGSIGHKCQGIIDFNDLLPIGSSVTLLVAQSITYHLSILLFKGFLLFGFLIFQFKNAPTPLCLSRNKIKGHSSKNAIVTPTKTLLKKQGHFPVNFYFLKILLLIFKLFYPLINQTLKIKIIYIK